MKTTTCSMFLWAAVLALFGASPERCAAWVPDGVPVCTAPTNQDSPEIASDGAGGAYITWVDTRDGTFDVYCQRLDGQGDRMWTEDGIPVCTGSYNQSLPQIMADGSGGAYITWQGINEYYERDIFAQHVDGNGSLLWTPGGIVICDADDHQGWHVLVADGSGGMIVAWEDARSDNNDIYAQRVHTDGSFAWAEDGVVIAAEASAQQRPSMVADGQGGAIVAWSDYRDVVPDVYAQRFNATGTPLWSLGGVPVCTFAEEQRSPRVAGDGQGGAIITWYDQRGDGDVYIYAQRVDAVGDVQWSFDGVAIAPVNNDQTFAQIASDGQGGAIIAWNQGFPGWDTIHVQRIDAGGVARWNGTGVAVGGETGNTDYPQIISDGQGGAVVAWEDLRADYWTDVYAQRLDAEGNALWTSGGVAVCTALWDQTDIRMTRTTDGTTILTWEDTRPQTERDLYAAMITDDGTPVSSVQGDTPSAGAGRLSCFPNPFNPRSVISFDLDRNQPVRLTVHDLTGRSLARLVDAVLTPGTHRYTWDGKDTAGRMVGAGTYLLRLETAHRTETHKIMLVR